MFLATCVLLDRVMAWTKSKAKYMDTSQDFYLIVALMNRYKVQGLFIISDIKN